VQQPVSWAALTAEVRDRLSEAGTADPAGVRFLLSAHASNEELFLFGRLAELWLGRVGPDAVSMSWRTTPKLQPEHTKFVVPDVDAANVNGGRLLGLIPGASGDPQGPADLKALRTAIEAGTISALYVYDPGPEGSIGDLRWVLDARAAGLLPLLIVQGVLLTELALAADFVLPGASFVEKEASYVNDNGRLQGTARAIPVPGEAMEDWQIVTNLSTALGVTCDYSSSASIRVDMSRRLTAIELFGDIAELAFARTMSARHWLQASNPSERWKWDFMFQDLPPIKGSVDPSSLPLPPGMIPMKELK
jgi:anaerobic selenocysteine-containing dehydrogenase